MSSREQARSLEMSDNVAALVQPADPLGVVTILETMLAEAKAGQITSFVAVTTTPNHTWTVYHSGTRDRLQMVGMLVQAQLHLSTTTIPLERK